MKVSLKVIPPFVIALVAAIVLALVFGNPSYLLLILGGLAQSGAASAAPPAPGVTQADVAELAESGSR